MVTVFLQSPPMLMVVNEEVAPPQFSEGFTVVPPWTFLTPEYPSSPKSPLLHLSSPVLLRKREDLF